MCWYSVVVCDHALYQQLEQSDRFLVLKPLLKCLSSTICKLNISWLAQRNIFFSVYSWRRKIVIRKNYNSMENCAHTRLTSNCCWLFGFWPYRAAESVVVQCCQSCCSGCCHCVCAEFFSFLISPSCRWWWIWNCNTMFDQILIFVLG